MVHLFEMQSGVAVWIFELTSVLRQERTGSVEIVLLGLVVERQRIELAAQRFVVAQLASLPAKVRACVFDAQVLMNRGFFLCERNF